MRRTSGEKKDTCGGGHPAKPEHETGDLYVTLRESIPGLSRGGPPEGNEGPEPVWEMCPVDEQICVFAVVLEHGKVENPEITLQEPRVVQIGDEHIEPLTRGSSETGSADTAESEVAETELVGEDVVGEVVRAEATGGSIGVECDAEAGGEEVGSERDEGGVDGAGGEEEGEEVLWAARVEDVQGDALEDVRDESGERGHGGGCSWP